MRSRNTRPKQAGPSLALKRSLRMTTCGGWLAKKRRKRVLENSCQRAAEPGQHVLAQQRSVTRDDVFRPVLPIHTRDPALRIDDPDESRTGIQPVPDLREDFTGTIMRGEDLDHEIRSEFEEGARDGLRQALSTDERDIGSAHRVGIPCQRKPGIPDEHRSGAGQIGVRPQPRAEVGGYVPVLAAGRLMHDEPAAHQLRPFVRHAGVQQLLGRHEWSAHVGNVGSALGHWQARSRVSINERSTTFQLRIFLVPSGTKLIFGFAEGTLGCGVPITPRLSQKLQQTLGGQEGAEFVNWMHEMDARVGDLIKWSFVFWVGAVGAIAMLARALR